MGSRAKPGALRTFGLAPPPPSACLLVAADAPSDDFESGGGRGAAGGAAFDLERDDRRRWGDAPAFALESDDEDDIVGGRPDARDGDIETVLSDVSIVRGDPSTVMHQRAVAFLRDDQDAARRDRARHV